jgi:hypothetical protein
VDSYQPRPMTDKDRADFMRGLSTPIDKIIDGSMDSFIKQKRRHEMFRDGWVFSLSSKAKENYDLIRWER